MTEPVLLRPAVMVCPGLYPLLMVNYWIRRDKTPVTAILISGYEIKHQGKYLNFFELVLGLWQETGFWYTLYMLMIAKFAVPIVRLWNLTRRLLGKEIKIKTYEELAQEKGIPFFRSKDFNGEETRLFLKNVNANIIVSAYNNQILKRETFNLPEFKSVNIHPAMLPNFRGLDGPFEAMYHGVKNAGVTIHYVDAKIDTGRIIAQEPVPVRSGDTLFSLSVRCWMHGAKLLERVFDLIKSGTVPTTKQNPKDIKFPYRSFPDKVRTKDFMKKRKLFAWQDLGHTFRD
jgi:methionyl-tRNA formyltransferase